jgi:hypothetical protein
VEVESAPDVKEAHAGRAGERMAALAIAGARSERGSPELGVRGCRHGVTGAVAGHGVVGCGRGVAQGRWVPERLTAGSPSSRLYGSREVGGKDEERERNEWEGRRMGHGLTVG